LRAFTLRRFPAKLKLPGVSPAPYSSGSCRKLQFPDNSSIEGFVKEGQEAFLNIALVHYHLRPGGVTSVMLRQARALLEAGDSVLAVSGESPAAPEDWAGVPVKVIPGLRYDRYREENSGAGPASASGETASLAETFAGILDGFRPRAVVVHNPLIRKNALLIGALRELVRRGFPLLLQNHDLAEDFRPDVYPDEDYPENCHYAVINSRDHAFLREAGLKAEGLHLLPNEVSPVSATSGLRRISYLYPVRAIRRKNIGEALLLSLFIPEGRVAAISQPPTTERDAVYYGRWKALAGELSLPVQFETGRNVRFEEVLGGAFAVITTSIKEGFGFSFLEPWTAGLAVTGRRIGYVCGDFERNGVNFEGFYGALRLPVCGETSDYPRRFAAKQEEARRALYAAFGAAFAGALPSCCTPAGEELDFGAMDEELQEDFIRKAAASRDLKNAAARANPFLEKFAAWKPDPALVEANRAAVLAAYSREKTASLLREACRAASRPVVQSISRTALLERFLETERLFLTGIA
jgi:hypothetical protein